MEVDSDEQTEGNTTEEANPTEEVLHATPGELRQWQQEDSSLENVRGRAEQQKDPKARVQFFYRDGLLYRCWYPRGSLPGDVRTCEQLVLPRQCRELVMRHSHDVLTAGHLGVTKMKDRVLQRYYWPGIFKDIASYCRSCGG